MYCPSSEASKSFASNLYCKESPLQSTGPDFDTAAPGMCYGYRKLPAAREYATCARDATAQMHGSAYLKRDARPDVPLCEGDQGMSKARRHVVSPDPSTVFPGRQTYAFWLSIQKDCMEVRDASTVGVRARDFGIRGAALVIPLKLWERAPGGDRFTEIRIYLRRPNGWRVFVFRACRNRQNRGNGRNRRYFVRRRSAHRLGNRGINAPTRLPKMLAARRAALAQTQSPTSIDGHHAIHGECVGGVARWGRGWSWRGWWFLAVVVGGGCRRERKPERPSGNLRYWRAMGASR